MTDVQLLLGGIVLVGFAIRAFALGAESLWVDEIHTVLAVSDNDLDYVVFRLPITDPHPPFYYAVLWIWTRFTGVSATTVRAFSVLASVASIPLVHAVATRLYDRRVGLLAALLFALSPFYVWYAREARMYALMTLLACWSFYTLLTWLDDEPGWWRGRWSHVATNVALIYTHAFGVLVVVAQAVYVTFVLDPDAADEDWFGGWARAQAVVGAASFPWFYNLLGGMFGAGRFQNNVAWIPEVTPLTPWKILGSYVGRTIPPSSPLNRRSLWTFGARDLSVAGEVVTAVALALLASLLVRHLLGGSDGDAATERRDETADTSADGGREPVAAGDDAGSAADGSRPERPASPGDAAGSRYSPGGLLACWLLVPVGVLYAVSVLVTPLLFDRFTAAFGVAALLLLARAITRLSRSDRQTLAAAGVAVLVLGVPLTGIYAQPQKEQWEAAVGVVESNADPGDAVLVTPFWTNESYQYYAEREDLRYVALPAGPPGWQVSEAVGDAGTVWVVVSHTNASQRSRLFAAMRAVGYERARHVGLTDVDVYRYDRIGGGG